MTPSADGVSVLLKFGERPSSSVSSVLGSLDQISHSDLPVVGLTEDIPKQTLSFPAQGLIEYSRAVDSRIAIFALIILDNTHDCTFFAPLLTL